MNTFSFRAELNADIDALLELLKRQRIEHKIIHRGEGPRVKHIDSPVEIEVDITLERLQDLVRDVPDGHVLLQTLRQCKLSDNSLDRQWDLH